jgi:hypothetical protein
VMMRLSTDPGSPYYALLATPGNGIVVQYRAKQGGGAQQSVRIATGTLPIYLMVARTGNTYSAYTSTDGVGWKLVPGSSITLANMTGTVLTGIAVSSYDASFLDTVTFDTVAVSTSLVCPLGWTCTGIGSLAPPAAR